MWQETVVLLIEYLSIALITFYYLAGVLYGIDFFKKDFISKHWFLLGLSLLIIIHVLYCYLLTLHYQHFPVISRIEFLSTICLFIVLIYLYIEKLIKIKSTGIFIFFLLSIFQTIAFLNYDFSVTHTEVLSSPFAILHTIVVMMGYSACIIAALYGSMYLILFYDIKLKHFGIIYKRLPSLEELDEMSYNSCLIGLIFMTASIALGFLSIFQTSLDVQLLDPKILLTLGIWLIFFIIFILKSISKLNGLVLSCLALTGFVLIIFSMFIFKHFFASFHSFL